MFFITDEIFSLLQFDFLKISSSLLLEYGLYYYCIILVLL